MTLMLIGVVDMVVTIFLVGSGSCRELNPLMAPLLNAHWSVFVLVKGMTLAAAFLVGEWYRGHDERFVRIAMKLGAIAYVLTWLVWFVSGWTP
jgi:hypothetical protein